MWLPMISCGICCGDSVAAAISLVTRSIATTAIRVPQKRGGLGLPLSIFFALLALDAIPGVRQRVEALETDLSPAIMAFAELLGIPVKATQRFVDVPQEPSLLACKEEGLFALERVGALIGHVERVGAQITVGALGRRPECLVVVPQLLEYAFPLLKKSLLKMLKAFFRHRLRFLVSCCCHFLTNPLQGDFHALTIKVERVRRVCSFDSFADCDFQGQYFIGNPFLKCLSRLLNFRTAANQKRDAIAYGETQFLPEFLDPAHQLPGQTLQPQLRRHQWIERGKIASFLLHHHIARSTSNYGQIFGAQLPRLISDRNEQRVSRLELPQRVTG